MAISTVAQEPVATPDTEDDAVDRIASNCLCENVRSLKSGDSQEGRASCRSSCRDASKPTVDVLAVHQAHQEDCDPFCTEHVWYVIRVLFHGKISPKTEAMQQCRHTMDLCRRVEEGYFFKRDCDFEDLHTKLQDEMNKRTWGTFQTLTVLPHLPERSRYGIRHSLSNLGLSRFNNRRVEALQEYFDRLLAQVSSLEAEPVLKQFFSTQRASHNDPLVQKILRELPPSESKPRR